MKIIIVDASREFTTSLRRLLASELPDVEVTEYDPEQQGPPPPGFDWSLYALLLLSDELGGGATGLDWLTRYRHVPGFPPTIMLANLADDYLAALALRSGACDFLSKQHLTPQRLLPMVRAATDARVLGEDSTLDGAPAQAQRRALACNLTLPPNGERIGFHFERLIGQGANSRIYLARRRGSRGPLLVVKVIDVVATREPNVLARFVREAELIAAIDVPQVVKFYAHGFTDSYGYLAMEFFARGDLKLRLERGIAPANAVRYFLRIVQGLRAIHTLGVIHRDLKPGNIMFRADDSLALADFGISRRIEEARNLTHVGSVLGTPSYLSPEQGLGRPTDQRTDLYSAGVILFQMLSGQKPFRAASAMDLIHQHIHAAIPELPATAQRFQPIVERLLAKAPADRYADAATLLAALQAIAPEASEPP
ncbi:MAG: hypothetical protein EXR83_07880 [Gammaproteobacteria bacterium]|nr:hypothetical protein [Gammaproteobacteria bacterium]